MEGQSTGWPRLHRLAADGDVGGLLGQLESGTDPNARAEDGATSLHVAVRQGQPNAAKALLENGANPDVRTHQGATPLEFAVRHTPQMIGVLIEGGARPHVPGAEGKSLLRVAIEEKQIDALGPLLLGGVDPSSGVDAELTPLSFASREGSVDVVAAIAKYAPRVVHDRDPSGSTALHHASCGGHPEVIKTLLAANADATSKDAQGSTPLHSAAAADEPKAVAALLAGGADPNARDQRRYSPLHSAARDAGPETLALLLDAAGALAADSSTPGETPFHLAVLHNNAPEVTMALLEAGADPNAKFSAEADAEHLTPLAAAAESGRGALVAALIAGGADPNDADAYPLREAIWSGDAATVEALLAGGADPEGPATGRPPLHLAAEQDADMVATLLRHGAASDIVHQGMTALQCVAEEMPPGAARIMRLLLRHGTSQRQSGGAHRRPPLQLVLGHDDPDRECIDVLLSDAFEKMDTWGGSLDGLDESWTPLHAAASNPNIPPGIVDTLIGGPFHCDCEAEGSHGTPLILAAGAGSLTAIAELLNRGVNPNGEDDCLRPLACAIEGGETAAVRTLLKAGARVDRHEHLDLALKAECAAWDPERPSSSSDSDVELVRTLIVEAIEADEVLAPEGDLDDRLEGSTPLHWAVAFATDATTLARCLRGQEDAQLRDEAGWSPLHWAACCNPSASVLQWLLDNGGDSAARTPDERTALEIADASGNATARRTLEQARGNSSGGGRRALGQRAASTRKPSAKGRRSPR